jgi:DNA-binding beta-propeller fold protein YncE
MDNGFATLNTGLAWTRRGRLQGGNGMRSSQTALVLVTTSFMALAGSAGHTEIAVSANDGKMVLENGVATVRKQPLPDTVSVIDLSGGTPHVIAEVPAPASVVGPPASVAIAPDESLALVTGAMKIDPGDLTKTVPDDKLTVIDLKSSPPRILATLQAGAGAAGVSINRAGTLAVVANRSEGTVSIFTIQTPEGVKMSPDGTYVAVNVANGSNKAKTSPFFNDFSLLKIYRIAGTDLVPVTEAPMGHWCQGIAWTKDSKTLLVQCMVESEIATFAFDGKTLTRTAPIATKVSPAGIRTAEP